MITVELVSIIILIGKGVLFGIGLSIGLIFSFWFYNTNRQREALG